MILFHFIIFSVLFFFFSSREVLLQASLLLPTVRLRPEEEAGSFSFCSGLSQGASIYYMFLRGLMRLPYIIRQLLHCGLRNRTFSGSQENQMPLTPIQTVDAPSRVPAAAAPSAEIPPSGTRFSSVDVVAVSCRLAVGVGVPLRALRRSLSWTCHQVALNPLDSPFLCTYCIYLFCCFTVNVLLSLL